MIRASIATEEMDQPFGYIELPNFLSREHADRTLEWLEADAPWKLRIESFYEQYEFDLLQNRPPGEISFLVEPDYVQALTTMLRTQFNISAGLGLVGISVHKLTAGQTIRIHNDFVGDEETHRVLIQLNRGWSVSNGGFLMLFGSDRADDVLAVAQPVHGSAFAFEISPQSYHAVSTIKDGERFTLVYTFRVES